MRSSGGINSSVRIVCCCGATPIITGVCILGSFTIFFPPPSSLALLSPVLSFSIILLQSVCVRVTQVQPYIYIHTAHTILYTANTTEVTISVYDINLDYVFCARDILLGPRCSSRAIFALKIFIRNAKIHLVVSKAPLSHVTRTFIITLACRRRRVRSSNALVVLPTRPRRECLACACFTCGWTCVGGEKSALENAYDKSTRMQSNQRNDVKLTVHEYRKVI